MCLKCRVCAAKGRGNDSIPTAIFGQTLPFSNLVFRLFIEVSTSTLIVGYNTVKIKGNQMNLLTVSWEKVGTEKVYLDDVMGKKGLVSVDETGDVMGDYINTWNYEVGSWGETYYYINQPSWNFEEGGKLIDYTDTWMGGNSGYPENTAIQPGAGFWYYAKENNVTLAFENPVK